VTLRPLYQEVRGVKGDPYKVGPRCCNPACRKIAEHGHHLWPRSYLRRQPQNWVTLPDGTVIGNLVAVCADCHDDITGRLGGHKAKISLSIPDNIFWWCIPDLASPSGLDWQWVQPIDPQPPTQASQVASPAEPEVGSCPTCGQARRRRSSKTAGGTRRRRKNWNVPVPADAEENGADVLDTLVEEVGHLLDRDADANGRYYILLPTLYFALQEPKRFLQNVLGAGA
jgi:hypothetical protein